MTHNVIVIALALLLIWLCPTHTLADTHYVSKTGLNIPPYTQWATAANCIQDAIDVSGTTGDTVLVAPGVYSGVGNRDLDFGPRQIVVHSSDGASVTIIECGADFDQPHRGVWFHSGQTSSTELDGFTFFSGFAPANADTGISLGGAVLCDSASAPKIRNCVFSGNIAVEGGAAVALINGSDALLMDCRFVGNYNKASEITGITGKGGAIRCDNSSPHIVRSEFRRNKSWIGGAASCSNSGAVFEDCVFLGDSAVTLLFFEPLEAGVGGAIHLSKSSVQILNCTFKDNVSMALAGLTYSGSRGGAIAMFKSYAKIDHCTFIANRAEGVGVSHPGHGGGIYSFASSLDVSNSIISFSSESEGIYCSDTSSNPSVTCTDIYGNESGDWVGCIAGQAGLFGNQGVDPLFCDDSADNLYLRSDSPCAATNNSCLIDVGAWPVQCTPTWVIGNLDAILPGPYLVHNFPNPFNASTQINYTLPQPGTVKLDVYDVLGRHVNTLVDDVQAAGEHSVFWHGKDKRGQEAGSGVYFYRLSVGGDTEVRKMVMVK